MDPDAALGEIRDLCAAGDPDAERLVELIDGLDRWCATGGVLPLDWQAYRQSTIA
jgi:hypothetical protein